MYIETRHHIDLVLWLTQEWSGGGGGGAFGAPGGRGGGGGMATGGAAPPYIIGCCHGNIGPGGGGGGAVEANTTSQEYRESWIFYVPNSVLYVVRTPFNVEVCFNDWSHTYVQCYQ